MADTRFTVGFETADGRFDCNSAGTFVDAVEGARALWEEIPRGASMFIRDRDTKCVTWIARADFDASDLLWETEHV